MKLRSIRWRLVASYMLLTLLTAGLVGALALSLVKERVEQQEVEYLTANANAAARQAAYLISPTVHQNDLQRLAQTSAFLGNVRVRILSTDKSVLADSGARSGLDTFIWLMPSAQSSNGYASNADDDDAPYIMSLIIGGYRYSSNSSTNLGQIPPGARYVIVQRQDGPWGRRFSFQYSSDDASNENSATGVTAAITTTTTSASTTGDDSEGRSNRTVTVPINSNNRTLGYLELSGAPNFSAETFSTMTQAVILAAVGASLLAGVVALFIGRGLTAPLNALALAANKMSAGDLTTRAPVMSNDETGQLASQFNQMAERLQTSFSELAAERDTLRRFIADASHELRTPITALKMFNELLRSGASDDPNTRMEFLTESQTQIERLEWITRNLLDLSRLDSGVANLELDTHDVGDILQASAAAFKPVAQERGVTLNVCTPDPPLSIRCDRARIQIALSNLIDNALKFTPQGGHIDVCAQSEPSGIQIWVQDSGAGIDPADLPHIFDRFYRGKSHATHGSGLGLALVKSVVQAHGGTVQVQSNPSQGSRFTITLPGGGNSQNTKRET
jgi:signal transduction histidine kinase